MSNLESIKKVLDSDAGLVVEDMLKPDDKKVVDNRFFLLNKMLN